MRVLLRHALTANYVSLDAIWHNKHSFWASKGVGRFADGSTQLWFAARQLSAYSSGLLRYMNQQMALGHHSADEPACATFAREFSAHNARYYSYMGMITWRHELVPNITAAWKAPLGDPRASQILTREGAVLFHPVKEVH